MHAGLNSSPKCQSLVFAPRQPLDIHPPYCRLDNLAKLRLFLFFLHFFFYDSFKEYKETSLASIKMPMNEHANEFIAPVMYHILKQTMFIRESSKKVHAKKEKRKKIPPTPSRGVKIYSENAQKCTKRRSLSKVIVSGSSR
jgi:hypothetical protein